MPENLRDNGELGSVSDDFVKIAETARAENDRWNLQAVPAQGVQFHAGILIQITVQLQRRAFFDFATAGKYGGRGGI